MLFSAKLTALLLPVSLLVTAGISTTAVSAQDQEAAKSGGGCVGILCSLTGEAQGPDGAKKSGGELTVPKTGLIGSLLSKMGDPEAPAPNVPPPAAAEGESAAPASEQATRSEPEMIKEQRPDETAERHATSRCVPKGRDPWECYRR